MSEEQEQQDSDRFVREVVKRIYGTKDVDSSQTAWGESDGSGLWASRPDLAIDRYSLKSLLYESDWVYIVNNLVATKISNQHLVVMEKEVIAGETIFRPAHDHELQELLDHPNPRESQNTLTYNWVIDLTLGGNGLVYHAPTTDTLHNLPFEKIQPDFEGAQGVVKKYLFESNDDVGGVVDFKVEDVLHAMKPNPSNNWWGLSAFIPGRSAVLFNKYSSEFLNSFYLKGATPQLTLEMDADVNEKSALRMLRSFEKAYGGRENQRRPLVTPKGVTAKPLTTTLADQQLITYINSNRETLINLLAIPKHELSIQDGGGLGSQEMRLSLRNFWLTTLKPTMGFIEGVLNKHFRERLGPNHVIRWDLSGVEALQDDEVKKAELADRLVKSGTMTPNEARQRIFKMDAHPDGNSLFGVVGRGEQLVPPPVIEEGERPSDNEPIRGMKALMQKQREEEEEKPKATIGKLTKGLFAKFFERLVPLMDEHLSPIEDEQVKESDAKKRKKRLDRALAELNKEILKAMGAFEENFAEQYSSVGVPVAESGHRNIVDASFDGQQAADIRAMSSKEKLQVLLKSRGIKSFSLINKTQTEIIQKRIRKGFKLNKSLQDITRSISQFYEDGAEHMAERVARTEVGLATMIGREAAFEDAKTVVGDIKKVWITAGDDRVRDGGYGNGDHVSLNNEEADKDGTWTTGAGNVLRFPLDPEAVPEERINCRCDMIFIEDL
tara:strand:- start:28 stop:2196 length:2169 start_codon:yes stop_codon:yes gene_type:complete